MIERMKTGSKLSKGTVEFELPFRRFGHNDFPDLYDKKGMANYRKYAERIRKSLYYGTFPSNDRPSLALTDILVDKFGSLCNQDGLEQLQFYDASSICYDACVTPCSVIVALLYLDRLRIQNPKYLSKTSSSKLFVVTLMVASKFLYDDGEIDEVFNDEWAASAAMMLSDLNEAEREFLMAIDWNLYVDVSIFLDGLTYIEAEVALRQTSSRGYYVYSDLVALSQILPPIWSSLLNLVGSALVICIVGYSATLAVVTAGTLLGKECSLQILSNLQNKVYTPLVSSGISNGSCYESVCNETSLKFEELDDVDGTYEDTMETKVDEISAKVEGIFETSLAHGHRLHALHTLTAALLLASSSSSAEFTDPISALPMPQFGYPWNNFLLHLFNNVEYGKMRPPRKKILKRKRKDRQVDPSHNGSEGLYKPKKKLFTPDFAAMTTNSELNDRLLNADKSAFALFHLEDEDANRSAFLKENGCSSDDYWCQNIPSNSTLLEQFEYLSYWETLPFQFSLNMGHLLNMDWLLTDTVVT